MAEQPNGRVPEESTHKRQKKKPQLEHLETSDELDSAKAASPEADRRTETPPSESSTPRSRALKLFAQHGVRFVEEPRPFHRAIIGVNKPPEKKSAATPPTRKVGSSPALPTEVEDIPRIETTVQMPQQAWSLEEVNFPPEVAGEVAGHRVPVTIYPEEQGLERHAESVTAESGCLIARDGTLWNDAHPAYAVYLHLGERRFRIPRVWLPDAGEFPQLDVNRPQYGGCIQEQVSLPSEWDLTDANVGWEMAERFAGREVTIEVEYRQDQPPIVQWTDPEGKRWRLPHTWRRRLFRLPDAQGLRASAVPAELIADGAGAVVRVNYHPGSLCCDPERVRVRFPGGKWPVPISACQLLGYAGDLWPLLGIQTSCCGFRITDLWGVAVGDLSASRKAVCPGCGSQCAIVAKPANDEEIARLAFELMRPGGAVS